MILKPWSQISKQHKSLLIVLVGVSVILAIRFGGWVIIARALRWALPLIVLYILWKRIFRK